MENKKKLTHIQKKWDLVVVGGGITGAGILREAVRNGFKTLLIEQKDFAWGTSSRSSKLVHGGLRYLKEGKIGLTRESVKERERLLEEAPGLVEPLDFLLPIYKDRGPGRWIMEAGLSVYDLIAGKWRHKFFKKNKFSELEPLIQDDELVGGYRFMDAQVDDARLVLRLISEAEEMGGVALNYTRATDILRKDNGSVCGVVLEDSETLEKMHVTSSVVINASGVWAESLHPSPEKGKHLRPLRGSHLIFPAYLIPVKNPVSFFNPEDGRPLFVIPWEGAVLLGTTDIDHDHDLSFEPSISKEEAEYLVAVFKKSFPRVELSLSDCISTFAGVRPVVSEGKFDPSQESREHVVWLDNGLVTVTGGKLTTFRALAWDTLKAAKRYLRDGELQGRREPAFKKVSISAESNKHLSEKAIKRLYGRYGMKAENIIDSSSIEDLEEIPGTFTLWAELPFTAEYEKVIHLEDLLLRRVRVGLLTPGGGVEHMARIRKLCQPVLNWDDARWEQEIRNYSKLWSQYYSAPE